MSVCESYLVYNILYLSSSISRVYHLVYITLNPLNPCSKLLRGFSRMYKRERERERESERESVREREREREIHMLMRIDSV
jgi:hypothetical protein